MVDAAQVMQAVLGGLFVAVAVMLLVSYIAFVRMQPDVRQLRLFTMGRRINRFLLAFTIGFLAIAVLVPAPILGIRLPAAASTAAIFVFIGGIFYGSLEILFIAWPLRRGLATTALAGKGPS